MTKERRRVEYVSIDQLRFDFENPRLPPDVADGNEQNILDWLLQDDSLLKLMASIGEHDYFDGESLLVAPHPEDKKVLIVVEGNRRLAAVRLLNDPGLATSRQRAVKEITEQAEFIPTELPVLNFGTRDEILNYLGYRHITGIKEWDPLAKARYLQQLYERRPKAEEETTKLKELATSIGSTRNYVAKLLFGLTVYNRIQDKDFFGIPNLDEKKIEFSVLTTALGYENIANWLGARGSVTQQPFGAAESVRDMRLKELTGWLFERRPGEKARIAESRDLQEFSEVVANERALGAFRNGASLKDAVLLTEMPTQTFRTAIYDSRSRLQLARDTIHLVDSPTQSDADVLSDIRKMSADLRTLVSDRLDSQSRV
jgi:hypothetical protein